MTKPPKIHYIEGPLFNSICGIKKNTKYVGLNWTTETKKVTCLTCKRMMKTAKGKGSVKAAEPDGAPTPEIPDDGTYMRPAKSPSSEPKDILDLAGMIKGDGRINQPEDGIDDGPKCEFCGAKEYPLQGIQAIDGVMKFCPECFDLYLSKRPAGVVALQKAQAFALYPKPLHLRLLEPFKNIGLGLLNAALAPFAFGRWCYYRIKKILRWK